MAYISQPEDGRNTEKASENMDADNDGCQNPERKAFLSEESGDHGSKHSLDVPPHDKGEVQLVSIAPDGGWGWMCAFSGFWIQFIHLGIFTRSFGLLYLAIGIKFPEAQDSTKAWIPSLLHSLTMILSPIVGIMATIFNPRKVMFTGGIITCIGLVSSAFTTSAGQLICTIGILCGIGGSCTTSLIQAVVGRYFHKKRAIANGFSLLGTSAGAFTMPYVIDLLLEGYSLRGTFIILGGVILHLLPCALLMRPVERYLKYEEKPCTENRLVKFASIQSIEQDIDATVADDLQKQKSKLNAAHRNPNSKIKKSRVDDVKCIARFSFSKYLNVKLLISARFVTIALANCCKSASNSFIFQFLPSLIVSRGASLIQATVLLSVSAASECVGRGIIGWFIYKTGAKSWVISCTCLGIASLMTFIMTLAPMYEVAMMSIVVYSFFLGCQASVNANVYVDDHGPENLISAYALGRASIGIFTLISSPILGLLKDTSGSYTLSYMVMSSLLFLSFVLHAVHPIATRFDTNQEERRKYAKEQRS